MNAKIKTIGIAIIVSLFILTACVAKGPQPASATTRPDGAHIVNPASAYCEDQGFKLEIRTAQNNNQYGVCVFKDNSECEEWAYYRDECKLGDMDVAPPPTATLASIANPASAYCAEQGGTSKIRTWEDGSQSAVCAFPNGSECDEWAFFRKQCAP